MLFKKAISCFLSLSFLLSSFIPAFAEENQNITNPDQSGKSDVIATVEASNFDITVPLGLPLYLHADGSVTTATDAKIENNSQGPVIVKNVKLTPINNWKLASFTDNYKTKKVNSKELGFQIMNENVLVDGSVDMKAEDWPVITGKDNINLNYDGKVPIRNSNSTVTAANLELTFDWYKNTNDDLNENYTVSIINNGHGSAYIDTTDKPIIGTYNYRDQIALINTPDEGYHFVNYTDENGNVVDSPYTVTGPITIKANFEANTYTVTANNDGNGTTSGGKNYKYGEQATLTATPNEHYHFTNWTDENNTVISNQSAYSFTVTNNIDYTAHFDIDQFTVTLTSDEHGSITGASSGTYDYGTELNITAVPDTGYHFVNYTDENGNVVDSPYTVTDSTTIKANFEANTYTVTTNDDGNGTTSGGKSYKYGEQATLTATPNEHYHFINWTDSNSNVISDQSIYSFTVTDNIDYTAHFSIDQFNVTLTSDEYGNITGSESGIYDYGTELSFTAVPTTGYHFVNYTDQNDNIISSPYTIRGPVTIKANFEINTYAVTANDDGNGTTSGSKDYKYGEQATLTATPNEHYHFVNWTDSDSNVISDQSAYSFTVTDNIDYTAHFSIDQFTVTLTSDEHGNITGASSGTYDYGTELNITAVPDTGYKLSKWSDNDTNSVKTVIVTGNTDLTAYFEKNTYTVTTIDDDHGCTYIDTEDEPLSGTYSYGDEINFGNLADMGYSFVNYTDQDGNVVTNPYTVNKDITVKANFVADKYNITVDKEGEGSVSGGGEYAYGSVATLRATPAEHYHFVNWTSDYGEESDDQVFNYEITWTDPITWTAHFEIDQFDIEVDTDEMGEVGGSGTYDYGEQVTVQAVPEYTYPVYVFSSWTDDSGNVISNNSTYTFTATKDMNLKANFVKKQYTASDIESAQFSLVKGEGPSENITLTSNGFKLYTDTSVGKSDYFVMFSIDTKDGHHFVVSKPASNENMHKYFTDVQAYVDTVFENVNITCDVNTSTENISVPDTGGQFTYNYSFIRSDNQVHSDDSSASIPYNRTETISPTNDDAWARTNVADGYFSWTSSAGSGTMIVEFNPKVNGVSIPFTINKLS